MIETIHTRVDRIERVLAVLHNTGGLPEWRLNTGDVEFLDSLIGIGTETKTDDEKRPAVAGTEPREGKSLDEISGDEAKAVLYQLGYFDETKPHFLALNFSDSEFAVVQKTLSKYYGWSPESVIQVLFRVDLAQQNMLAREGGKQ